MPSLDTLPVELLAIIATMCAWQDACNLRLTSRAVEAGSHAGFKEHIACKTIDCTSIEQVRDLEYFTQPGYLGCYLKDLIVLGIVQPMPKPKHSGADVVSLSQAPVLTLTRAFNNLRLNTPLRSLRSLDLRIRITRRRRSMPIDRLADWRHVWYATARLFEVVLGALAENSLPVDKLDIFGSVKLCSLACDQIGLLLDRRDLSVSFAHLKELRLSVSDLVDQLAEAEAADVSDMPGGRLPNPTVDVTRLLKFCPQLESLDLHWMQLNGPYKDRPHVQGLSLLAEVVQLDPFPKLRKCRLVGIRTDEATVLAFLNKVPQLSHLELAYFNLRSGGIGPVLDYLTNQLPALTYLRLEDISDPAMVRFLCRQKGNPPPQSVGGSFKLTRTGPDCQSLIKYRSGRPGQRMKSSPESWQLQKRIRALYRLPAITNRIATDIGEDENEEEEDEDEEEQDIYRGPL